MFFFVISWFVYIGYRKGEEESLKNVKNWEQIKATS